MKLNSGMLITGRQRKGWNQTELAEKSGVSVVTISKAENGNDVRPSTGVAICTTLDIDLAAAVIPVESENGDAA